MTANAVAGEHVNEQAHTTAVPPRPCILHVLPGLVPGGAEQLLLAWVRHDAGRTEHWVLSLRAGGALAGPLADAGARVLEASGARSTLTALAQVRRRRPNAVLGWLHHGNAAALAVRTLAAPNARLAFSHHGGPHPPPGPWHRRLAQAVERAAWRLPAAHLYAARTACRWDAQRGRDVRRAWVLPAAIDTEVFSPAAARPAKLRRALGLRAEDRIVGMVGRYDPAKDHVTGLRAFFHRHEPTDHLLLVGPGVHPLPGALARELSAEQRAFVHTLPARTEGMAELIASLDVLLVSSRSESLPRVTLEAMACGVPCVTTAVGDASELLEVYEWVAPVGDSKKLSATLRAALKAPLETNSPVPYTKHSKGTEGAFFDLTRL